MSRSPNSPEPETSLEVRAALVHALQLDLVGPGPDGEHAEESLPGWERPSVWYLTGFLVPTGTPAAERADDDEDDDFDGEIPERAGLAEESAEHGKRAKRRFFPSSMGLSTNQALRGPALDRFLLGNTGRCWDGMPDPRVVLYDLDPAATARFRTRATSFPATSSSCILTRSGSWRVRT